LKSAKEIRTSKRVEVLDRVSKAVGFPIREDECSPQHRLEITKLGLAVEKQESMLNEIRKMRMEVPDFFVIAFILLPATVVVFLCIYIGEIVNAFISGVAAGAVALLSYIVSTRKYRARINEKRRLTLETAKLKKYIDAEINELARSIKDYLSTVDKAKTRGPITFNFEKLLGTLKRKGIILQTIECPNCGGKLEISKIPKQEEIIECKHCGKPILAVNVLEKLKELLNS